MLVAAPHIYLALPISLNSLDREGAGLPSPCGSRLLSNQMQGLMTLFQMTHLSSNGSSTRTHAVTMCHSLMISSGAQLGSIGDRVAFGVLLLFWFRSRTLFVSG